MTPAIAAMISTARAVHPIPSIAYFRYVISLTFYRNMPAAFSADLPKFIHFPQRAWAIEKPVINSVEPAHVAIIGSSARSLVVKVAWGILHFVLLRLR